MPLDHLVGSNQSPAELSQVVMMLAAWAGEVGRRMPREAVTAVMRRRVADRMRGGFSTKTSPGVVRVITPTLYGRYVIGVGWVNGKRGVLRWGSW